jgi:3-phenylpropionate/trans-cinnamate dioxygenase ferredoxin subunit
LSKEITWHQIATTPAEIQFASNDIAVVDVNGKPICIGKFRDRLFAFAYRCPHAGGIMADAYINALGQVACPIHRYKFDLVNGRNVTGEGYYLKNWPVELRDNGVFVGMEKPGIWNLF